MRTILSGMPVLGAKLFTLFAVLALLAQATIGSPSLAAKERGNSSRALFGPIGIVSTDTVRVNLVAFPPDPCTATVTFFGADGRVAQGPTVVNLAGRQATFVDLRGSDLIPAGVPATTRAQIRVVVQYPPDPCAVATLEVFDNINNKTNILVPPGTDLFAPPGPNDRIQLGMLGIVEGQTARLSIVAVPPGSSERRFPTTVTVELAFTDSTGRIIGERFAVELQPGQLSFLDLPAGQIGRTQIGATVTVPPGPSDRSLTLAAAVEVFENATGRTSFVLVPPGPSE